MAELEDNDPVRTFVENLIECSMCMEEMETPKFLQCGHSFCLKCLRKQCEPKHHFTCYVVCALCRHSTKIPKTGLERLPSSFLIEDAKECFKKAKKLGLTTVRLPFCDEPAHNQVLNIWCETCMELICGVCRGQHHKHIISTNTFIEAFRGCKCRYEQKIAEMEKAYTECQLKNESLVREIERLKETRKQQPVRKNKGRGSQAELDQARHENREIRQQAARAFREKKELERSYKRRELEYLGVRDNAIIGNRFELVRQDMTMIRGVNRQEECDLGKIIVLLLIAFLYIIAN
ncbi:E3 ubiquitin-protein ligase TRIM39-like [Antedon mediterranea]|uniref:E3 ubiquitin-protein ligase TRIM39-like n=1 Tax=Antedon mediterranea TaxID=105859 RepID=UPI003AF76C3E